MEGRQGRKQQLTIFYSGSVCIFDNVPADRAEAVMQLLSEDDSSSNNSSVLDCGSSNPLMLVQEPVVKGSKANFSPSAPQDPKAKELLPFARKASFASFLEKQKDQVPETMQGCEDAAACWADSRDVEMLGSPCSKRMKLS